MTLLSIITAVHPTHVGWLETCGASILSQELPQGWSLEWCVQLDDDAKASHNDPRVKVASNHAKLGASHSRNMAAARAQGDVFMHLDADDVLLSGALNHILEIYADDTISWVAVRVDDIVGQDIVKHPHELSGVIEPGVVSAMWLSSGRLPFHSAAFTMRRDAFFTAGCYPALVAAEDVGLVLAVSDHSRGVVLKDTLAQYRKWSLQTTASSKSYTDLRPLCIQVITEAITARQSFKH